MQDIPVKTYQFHAGDDQIHMMHIQKKEDQLHRHIYFELVYIMKGSATHQLEKETAPLRAGDYFIIDPGSAHCYREPKDFEIVNCLFMPEYIDRALKDCPSLSSLLSNRSLHFGVPVDIRAADSVYHDSEGSVRRMIQTMEHEYTNKRTGYMELLRCYLTQILVSVARAWESAEGARVAHSATTAITEYLRANYAQPLSLGRLSDLAGYTPQYLSNLFRKDTGMSIREFLQRLRVEEACRLLEQKQQKLSEIAGTVGYSDAKHFARIFRRYKGVCLKDYRKSL